MLFSDCRVVYQDTGKGNLPNQCHLELPVRIDKYISLSEPTLHWKGTSPPVQGFLSSPFAGYASSTFKCIRPFTVQPKPGIILDKTMYEYFIAIELTIFVLDRYSETRPTEAVFSLFLWWFSDFPPRYHPSTCTPVQSQYDTFDSWESKRPTCGGMDLRFCAVFGFARNQHGIMFEIWKGLDLWIFCFVQVAQLAQIWVYSLTMSNMFQQTALNNTMLVALPAIIMVQCEMDVSPIAVTFRIKPFSPNFSTQLAIMTEGQSYGYTQSPTSRHGVFFFGVGTVPTKMHQTSVCMVCFPKHPWKWSFFNNLSCLLDVSWCFNLQEA